MKDTLLKTCNLIFSISDFDIGLFDQNINSLCFLTQRNYPNSLLKCFTHFESQLLSHPENRSASCCLWMEVSELEFLYLIVRIQVSNTEHYYAAIGPALMLSYSDALVKTIMQQLYTPLSEKENFYTLYKSLPLFQTKTKNLFLTCYNLLTAPAVFELPPLFPAKLTDTDIFSLPAPSPQASYSKTDIQYNYEKEYLWRKAVSRGDIKSAKQAFSEMLSTDYLYCTPDDSLQTRKHILFSINTLCRTAATDGGADFISASQTHNTFFLLIKTLTSNMELDVLILRILETYCKLVRTSIGNEFSPLVKKAISYIYTHYDQPLTLHMTAEAVSCGESHLSRCFHKETGKTFKAYVNEYRISQAVSLLETELYQITDIALLVGFSSYTKFSVVFKQIMGMSASEYLAKRKL